MSTSKKPNPRDELERIEDALIESILNAPSGEIQAEMVAAGFDPEKCIAEVEAAISAAKTAHGQVSLNQARAELLVWRARASQVGKAALETARSKFERLRAGDPDLQKSMMLAARKGEGLSDNDLEEVIENLAAIEELEGEYEND